jgi:ABC-type branched-subunit amino acid transport system substrate-binding protein
VISYRLTLMTVYCSLITACLPVTRPVVKIALVAPFEGRYRNVGYEVLYAVRLAVREANANGGIAGYSIDLFALDDSGDVKAAIEQALKVAADPQVVGIIGHWLGELTTAAAPEYDGAGLPLLATGYAADLPASAFRLGFPESPCAQMAGTVCPESAEELRLAEAEGQTSGDTLSIIVPAPLPADSTDPAFADRYRAISNGTEPSFNAVLAYDAAYLLFDAIERAVNGSGEPTRAGVAAALAQSQYAGVSGDFSFDEDHNWQEAQAWAYRWRAGEWVKP